MEFLLECIGFPPDHDLGELARRIETQGEPCPWRGPEGQHLRLPLAGGFEVRFDREKLDRAPSLWPHFDTPHRLRVAVQSIRPLPDCRNDLLLHGTANPPLPDADLDTEAAREEYPLAAYLTDARRVRQEPRRGHVLAVRIAAFSLDVSYLGPSTGVRDPYLREEPHGARLAPAGDPDRPGGTMEVSLTIRSLRHVENPLTGAVVDVLETDAPGRPLDLFLSRWQVAESGFEPPRPGWRVEGAFVFIGRTSGGLPSAGPPRAFG